MIRTGRYSRAADMRMILHVAWIHFRETVTLLTGLPMMQDLAEGPEHPVPVEWL